MSETFNPPPNSPRTARTKSKVATPAVMKNILRMWLASSSLSSTLGTSMGGTRNPMAMPSYQKRKHNRRFSVEIDRL